MSLLYLQKTQHSMSFIYKAHHLPTSEPTHLVFLAGKYSALRLSALTDSAAAFSSTFEHESSFTPDEWVTRLREGSRHFFIVVAYAANTGPERQTIDGGAWVGSATLLGPFSKEDYVSPESGGPEVGDDGSESKWQMTAVYTSPSHRRKGLANLLIKAVEEFAAREGGQGKRSRIRIMIHPDNIAVKKLYSPLGFKDAGMCTLAEAYLSSGEVESLPQDGGASNPEKYHNRVGFIMEKVH